MQTTSTRVCWSRRHATGAETHGRHTLRSLCTPFRRDRFGPFKSSMQLRALRAWTPRRECVSSVAFSISGPRRVNRSRRQAVAEFHLSFSRTLVTTLVPIGRIVVHATLASSTLWGCAENERSPSQSTDVPGGPTCAPGEVGCVQVAPSIVGCATPAEGCACDDEGATVDCGKVLSVVGTQVNCSIGKRVCRDGEWGACKGDYVAQRSSTIGTGLRLAALGMTPNGCAQNPCNPLCAEFLDTASGLTAPPDQLLDVTDAGLTLQPGLYNDDGPECTAFTVSPSTQTITVTAINGSSALPTTTPAALTFTGALTPAGCFDGEPPANWILDRPDLAIMTPTGRMTVVAPVAGPIHGTAYLGLFPGVAATANVIVNANETDPAVSAATRTRFGGTSSTADSMTILYPYPVSSGRPTIFPLGLAAPVVQWNTGGSAADAVKISLRYPAGTGALFSWTRILPEAPITLQSGPVVSSHGPAATISPEVWWA